MSQTRTNTLYRTSHSGACSSASSVTLAQPDDEPDARSPAQGYAAARPIHRLPTEPTVRAARWLFEPDPTSQFVTYLVPHHGQTHYEIMDLTDMLALFAGDSAQPDELVFGLRPSSTARIQVSVKVLPGRLSLVAPDESPEAE